VENTAMFLGSVNRNYTVAIIYILVYIYIYIYIYTSYFLRRYFSTTDPLLLFWLSFVYIHILEIFSPLSVCMWWI
jgi:hypothetical protein